MGISHATASKWMNRYEKHGQLSLVDHSSAPWITPYTPRRKWKIERYSRILAEEFRYARTWHSDAEGPPRSRSGTGTTTTTGPTVHPMDSRQPPRLPHTSTTSWPHTASYRSPPPGTY